MAGYYSVQWDGKTDNGQICPSGIYLVRLTTAETSATTKIVLVR
ncbi:T9SS type A sorting domain-containing protein [candidate division KSB1 bacterium]|nr:T9SS type A sorting domain-containing protein [candidate division KSB1 bacterium]